MEYGSGVQKAFCDKHGITVLKFQYWDKSYKDEKSLAAGNQSSFTKMDLPADQKYEHSGGRAEGFHPKILELGFTRYRKNYQCTGINKNWEYLLFDFAFGTLNMERVGLGANSKNERSINAMKSVGCTVEGILRSRGCDANGGRIDSIILSILKNEWQNEWKEKLKSKTVRR